MSKPEITELMLAKFMVAFNEAVEKAGVENLWPPLMVGADDAIVRAGLEAALQ